MRWILLTRAVMIASGVFALLEVPLCSTGRAQTSNPPAIDLVRLVAAQELAAAESGGYFRYTVIEETPHGSETRDTIETRHWAIDKLILENGKPLSPARRKQEDERLREILGSRARLRKLENDEASNKARRREMLTILPEACLYKYAEPAEADRTQQLIRLEFHSNPAFPIRTWELRPLQSLEGTLLVDPVASRLVRLEAKLFRDIDFGWGLLGHISRGGTFVMEQQAQGSGQWAVTTVALHFTTRRLLVASSRVDSVSTVSDFHSWPEELTIQKGLEELLNQKPITDVSPAAALRAAQTPD